MSANGIHDLMASGITACCERSGERTSPHRNLAVRVWHGSQTGSIRRKNG
jgi:hypothetical protein